MDVNEALEIYAAALTEITTKAEARHNVLQGVLLALIDTHPNQKLFYKAFLQRIMDIEYLPRNYSETPEIDEAVKEAYEQIRQPIRDAINV